MKTRRYVSIMSIVVFLIFATTSLSFAPQGQPFQELEQMIEEQAAEIEQLENEVDALESALVGNIYRQRVSWDIVQDS